jgi:hypothetical protein
MSSPGGYEERPQEMTPLQSPLSSEVLSVSSGGVREPRDMMEYPSAAAPAPAPVVARIGGGRSGSVVSHHSGSVSRPNYSTGEWVQGIGHTRSGSLGTPRPGTARSGGAMQRPGTSRSEAPSMGLWGIDPTGRGGRSDSQGSQAGPSGTVGRSGSQRSARIVTSPLEMAGQRYDMVFEV